MNSVFQYQIFLEEAIKEDALREKEKNKAQETLVYCYKEAIGTSASKKRPVIQDSVNCNELTQAIYLKPEKPCFLFPEVEW